MSLADRPNDLARSVAEQRTRQGVWGPYKTPTDLARYATIIGRVRPRTLIETGTWNGMSARWFAELVPRVVTIDRHNWGRWDTSDRGDICYLRGSSASDATYIWVDADDLVRGPVMVSLDSDHHPDHVFAELEVWAPFVTPGSYLVVEDTIVGWIDDYRERFGDGPLAAIEKWLPAHPEFEVDHDIEDLFPTTQHPGGWLRRRG